MHDPWRFRQRKVSFPVAHVAVMISALSRNPRVVPRQVSCIQEMLVRLESLPCSQKQIYDVPDTDDGDNIRIHCTKFVSASMQNPGSEMLRSLPDMYFLASSRTHQSSFVCFVLITGGACCGLMNRVSVLQCGNSHSARPTHHTIASLLHPPLISQLSPPPKTSFRCSQDTSQMVSRMISVCPDCLRSGSTTPSSPGRVLGLVRYFPIIDSRIS